MLCVVQPHFFSCTARRKTEQYLLSTVFLVPYKFCPRQAARFRGDSGEAARMWHVLCHLYATSVYPSGEHGEYTQLTADGGGTKRTVDCCDYWSGLKLEVPGTSKTNLLYCVENSMPGTSSLRYLHFHYAHVVGYAQPSFTAVTHDTCAAR